VDPQGLVAVIITVHEKVIGLSSLIALSAAAGFALVAMLFFPRATESARSKVTLAAIGLGVVVFGVAATTLAHAFRAPVARLEVVRTREDADP